jgi:hypothetical protein
MKIKAVNFFIEFGSALWLVLRAGVLSGSLFLALSSIAWLYGHVGIAAALCYSIFLLLILGNLPSVRRASEARISKAKAEGLRPIPKNSGIPGPL